MTGAIWLDSFSALVLHVAFIAKNRDDARGEPSRTALRWVFLVALREAAPGMLNDLWDSCMESARAVLHTASSGDRGERLLALQATRGAGQARQRARDAIREGGHSAVRDRLLARADARETLWGDLVQWASGNHLTDRTGSTNVWLLSTALRTLRQWAATCPGVDGRAPRDLDWTLPGARVGAPVSPAPSFRQRKHGRPETTSRLGPLARDLEWLARYVCTEQKRRAFAGVVARATVVQQVRRAARVIGFELPDRLRPPHIPDPCERHG